MSDEPTPAGNESVRLSVVVPMFNEEAVVALLFDRLRPVLDGLGFPQPGATYDVVCVDDGSTDATAAILISRLPDWAQLRVVRLVRNAGHQAALTAGFASSRGDYVVTIDADLQDPPESIVEMMAAVADQHVDVVYGVRSDRSSDSWFKRTTSGLYYRLMRSVAGRQVPSDAGDFRLVSRRVVEAMGSLAERGQVHRLMIPWFGFPSTQVTYVRAKRAGGTTHYPLSTMASLAFDSLIAFSAAPLRLATWAGFLGGVVALLALVWSIYGWATGMTVPGWTSILAIAGFLGAIQLICLGVLGEYVARIFVGMQQRPTYLVGYDSLHDVSGADVSGAGERRQGPPTRPAVRGRGR